MRKVFYLLTVVAFLVSATVAFAADKPVMPGKASTPEPQKTINCCVKGECKKVANEGDCAKAGGKVVKDCKECSGK